jgi:small subunit ribosomal protein S9
VEEAPAAEEAPAVEEAFAAEEAPAVEEAPAAEEAPAPAAEAETPPKPRPKRDRKQQKGDEPEVIPGAHLEPDLVLEEATVRREAAGGLVDAEIEAAEQALGAEGDEAPEEEAAAPEVAPMPASVLELAADARYHATGKRKSAVARVVLRPGTGVYTVNGREMNAFFPRPTLQTIVRQPLQAVGHEERMDVIAKIHGGGVSAQAGALRHGISKALTEADPNLRGELKRRGYLTRDARVKERKKAGLKKARKRPQFSKR